MSGKMSTGIDSMLNTPRIRISSAKTTKVYGRTQRKPDDPHHRAGIRSLAGVFIVLGRATGLPSIQARAKSISVRSGLRRLLGFRTRPHFEASPDQISVETTMLVERIETMRAKEGKNASPAGHFRRTSAESKGFDTAGPQVLQSGTRRRAAGAAPSCASAWATTVSLEKMVRRRELPRPGILRCTKSASARGAASRVSTSKGHTARRRAGAGITSGLSPVDCGMDSKNDSGPDSRSGCRGEFGSRGRGPI